MHGFRKFFFQRGSNLTAFFFFFCFFFVFYLVDEGRDGPNTTKSGPSSARQRNAIQMTFRWRADDGQTLNAGFAAFCYSRGSGPVLLFSGGSGPPAPCLDPRM